MLSGIGPVARWSLPGLCLALFACSSSPESSNSSPSSTGDVHDNGNSVSIETPPLPLSTLGRYVIDAEGKRVKLASVNWYGASDARKVVGGLDKAPIADIVGSIRALGFNSVRLPFANWMLHEDKAVDPAVIAANPEMTGLKPIEVYDRVVAELTKQGVMVLLNNHTTHSMWCCNFDSDGLWYTSDYSEDAWINDWAMMAGRYRDNPRVIAADLRNEVRPESGGIPQLPNWASAPNDWRAAAERAGNRVLQENPKLLVVVEGINYGSPLSTRPHLRPVAADPIRLDVPHKLIYSAHNYGYIGPSEVSGPKYGDMGWDQFKQQMFDEWGYVALTQPRAYTAPVWLSEFGDGADQTRKDWFNNIVRYLGEGDFDFAYWALNPGPKASGDDEPYALLDHDWKTPLADFRIELIKSIQAPKSGPGIEDGWASHPENHFEVLLFSDWDTNQSTNRDDWSPSTFKATCGDKARVIGVTTGLRALQRYAHTTLCSDFALSPPTARGSVVQNNGKDAGAGNVHTGGTDWASGYLKLECAADEAVVGLSQSRSGLTYSIGAMLCAKGPAYRTGNGACHNVVADGADDRSSQAGGDWDPDHSKAQCADSEYVAGVSISGKMLHSILCCPGG